MTGAENSFQKLIDIMKKLRSCDGCPWDREQTHESLKQYLIEECHEVIETIDKKNFKSLKEELGDLLLQPVFHAQIAAENDEFTIFDVVESINEKLIRRHPHVFGNKKINTSEEQKVHWEKIKRSEGKKSAIDGVPKTLPSLLRAHRLQQKAATVGFDWDKTDQVWDKIFEEIDELKNAITTGEKNKIEEEFGDLLFSLVNLSRFLKTNPEENLRRASDKFCERFRKIEEVISNEKKNIENMSLEELDKIWNSIKKEYH